MNSSLLFDNVSSGDLVGFSDNTTIAMGCNMYMTIQWNKYNNNDTTQADEWIEKTHTDVASKRKLAFFDHSLRVNY